MRVFFSNLGCKLNQAEVEAWARRLLDDGHTIVKRLEDADLHVVNSCTVTHHAARDSRKVARRAAHERREIRTVVTGCYATEEPGQAAALRGVDLVVPNARKDRLVEELYERIPELAAWSSREPADAPEQVAAAPVAGSRTTGAMSSSDLVPCAPRAFFRTRAALKIEDGCNMACAFCVIPATRGRQRSRGADAVIRELQDLERRGHREVVITGVQISAYRDGDLGLVELVERMLAATTLPRLRLTSIAPWQFDRRLLELLSDRRLCRHVHLSLQSGCDATLRRMRRPYDTRRFAALVDELRDRVPGIAITTDVIVGFPGESELELEASAAFVRAMGFARAHVFSYSERAGTAAATMVGAVPSAVRTRRTLLLRHIAAEAELAFCRSQLGTEAEVLWEAPRAGVCRGTTDNYVRVVRSRDASEPLKGRGIERVRLVGLLPAAVELIAVEATGVEATGVEATGVEVTGVEVTGGGVLASVATPSLTR